MKRLNMNFNNNYDQILSLALECQDYIVIIKKFDINSISIISLRNILLQIAFSN